LLALIIFSGHLGGEITHGENFVLAPVKKEKEKKLVAFDDALVYEDLVEPIFRSQMHVLPQYKESKGTADNGNKRIVIERWKERSTMGYYRNQFWFNDEQDPLT
jgi:hypothetical protein